jgi:hypothetical protein
MDLDLTWSTGSPVGVGRGSYSAEMSVMEASHRSLAYGGNAGCVWMRT